MCRELKLLKIFLLLLLFSLGAMLCFSVQKQSVCKPVVVVVVVVVVFVRSNALFLSPETECL